MKIQLKCKLLYTFNIRILHLKIHIIQHYATEIKISINCNIIKLQNKDCIKID